MKILFKILFPLVLSLQASELRVITTEFSPGIGMFAAANQVLGQLYLFEKGALPNVVGLTVDFDQYGLYYDPSYGPNWWSYYFEPINLGDLTAKRVTPTKEEYKEGQESRAWITRAKAAKLVKKYIHVKPHIQEIVDTFVARNFQNHYVVGIHYRGTDKKSEAPRVVYKEVFEEIDEYIPKNKDYRIFVATDEINFLERIKEKYPTRVIAIDAYRSTGKVGVHFLNKNDYFLGEEAVVDALLLSRCDVLIRTSSNLSLWSTYFNPDLPVSLLNLRYRSTLEPE